MKIDNLAAALRAVYPDFNDGDIVVPAKVNAAMIIIQAQHQEYTVAYISYIDAEDRAKFEFSKVERSVADFIEEVTIKLMQEGIPDKFLKNKELTDYYVKYGSLYADQYKKLRADYEASAKRLAKAKSDSRKCEALLKAIQIALETATQIMSYLKHDQKMVQYGN